MHRKYAHIHRLKEREQEIRGGGKRERERVGERNGWKG